MTAEDTDTPGGGALVISLDFELMWGVRDKRTIADYGRNILGVRQAVPALLDLFAARDIACTWATVGFLFCADKDELMASLPARLPAYANPSLSPYDDLAAVGADEKTDPYHFGLSLLRQVQSAPRQEIATHTFSHFYCLEEGSDLEAFRADLVAAIKAAERRGLLISSIAFPRNQMSGAHLRICRELGLTAFRGTEADLVPPGAARGRAVGAGARLPPGRQLSAARRGTGSCADPGRRPRRYRVEPLSAAGARGRRPRTTPPQTHHLGHGTGGAPRQNFSSVVASA